jgi:hypothetical protein
MLPHLSHNEILDNICEISQALKSNTSGATANIVGEGNGLWRQDCPSESPACHSHRILIFSVPRHRESPHPCPARTHVVTVAVRGPARGLLAAWRSAAGTFGAGRLNVCVLFSVPRGTSVKSTGPTPGSRRVPTPSAHRDFSEWMCRCCV